MLKLVSSPSVEMTVPFVMRHRMFSQLCRDDIPMVRKAACSALGSFARAVEGNALHEEIIPLFTKLSEDEQDSVRIVAVDNCVAFGSILGPEQTSLLVL